MGLMELKNNYIKGYICEDGFARKIQPDGTVYLNDNLIKILSEFYILCKLAGIYHKDDEERYVKAINQLWAREDGSEEVVYGLLTRRPLRPFGTDKHAGEIEQHDDYCSLSCGHKDSADKITAYGSSHWWHFDLRTWSDYKKQYGTFKLSLREWFRTTRQPYQKAIIELRSFGFTDPISLLHLIIVLLIEPFKSGTSGKLLLWAFSETQWSIMGKCLAFLFHLVMWTNGKEWRENTFDRYYGSQFPAHAEFAREVFKYDK